MPALNAHDGPPRALRATTEVSAMGVPVWITAAQKQSALHSVAPSAGRVQSPAAGPTGSMRARTTRVSSTKPRGPAAWNGGDSDEDVYAGRAGSAAPPSAPLSWQSLPSAAAPPRLPVYESSKMMVPGARITAASPTVPLATPPVLAAAPFRAALARSPTGTAREDHSNLGAPDSTATVAPSAAALARAMQARLFPVLFPI